METDAIRLLRARRADLWNRLEEVRARGKEYEGEIQQIDAGLRAMEAAVIPVSGSDASLRAVAYHARNANPEVQVLTMKQLVVKALSEHLENGATANEMLDFFARKWGRTEIMRTSLSPQLSRLKEDGAIRLEGKVWKINRDDFDTLWTNSEPDSENGEAAADPEVDHGGGANAPAGPDQPIATPASTS
jgi:hypothetical protein